MKILIKLPYLSNNFNIIFCWVTGHSVFGNDWTDSAAEEAVSTEPEKKKKKKNALYLSQICVAMQLLGWLPMAKVKNLYDIVV